MTHSRIAGQRFLPRGVRVLFQDRSLLVVEKPPGLLTMGTEQEKQRTLYWALSDWVRKGNPKSRERVFIVHRLDRETSGLLVFARNEDAKHQLQTHWDSARKHYLAVIQGSLGGREGEFDSLLAENAAHHVYSTGNPAVGKPSRTRWCLLREHAGHSLLELELLTGRKHQIRVHLADTGHPVCGDRRYGGPPHERLALHALRLEFPHPHTGEHVAFAASMPEGFSSLVGGLDPALIPCLQPGALPG